MSAALKGRLIRSLPAFPERAQQKKQTIGGGGGVEILWLLIVCLQPICVHAGWLAARRCCGVKDAADILTLMALLMGWVGVV